MDSNFHFGPARGGEVTAYGARTPDASPTSICEWADFMRGLGVTRVCCLLDAGQLAGFPVNLETEYKRLFGAACVLMEPIADHHLCSRQALRGSILPFLSTADTDSERVVIHCWGGNGRTGHVLAAWLVAARGLSPMEAIEAVEATGRLPREAVLAGNATLDELIGLLASCEPDRAAAAVAVRVTSRALTVELRDGRTVSAPLAWYPRLAHGTPRERQLWELIGPGLGIHWPALDEDISVEGLLQGRPSGESEASFSRWLNSRPRPAHRRLQPTKARQQSRTKRTSKPRLRG